MKEAMVYMSAVGFAFSLFPVHFYNYIYINTENKYASLNSGLYGLINLFNVNTVKDRPGEMEVNGKSKKIDPRTIKASAYKIFNSLCIYKIVQLGDFGMKQDKNAYALLTQNSLTVALYKFIQTNGNYAKLRNYTIANEEHGFVRYYLKAVTIVNSFVIAKIIMILILEKLNVKAKQK